MTKKESQQITYTLADLEALREFNPPLDPHKPKLDRAIARLQRLMEVKPEPSK